MSSLADIPLEVLIDDFLPLLPLLDLLHLGSTNKFFYQVTSDETFWHRKLQEDFNFSDNATARSTGWRFLYSRLHNPQVYVWGEGGQSRLGLPGLSSTQIGPYGGVPYPRRLSIPGVRIVSLVAGGMSFHAIDALGDVYVWGTLDATGFSLRMDGFSEKTKPAETPMKLKLPLPIRSISCGRIHTIALDSESSVWIFTSWGRPFRLASPALDKSSPEATVIQAESGWTFSAVLTASGDVHAFWPRSGVMEEHIRQKEAELDAHDEDSKAIPSEAQPNVIPCYTWDLRGVHPKRLPPIPADTLPTLPSSGQHHDNLSVKLVKIAGLDNHLIGLTNHGHVLRYGSLQDEQSYTRGRWEYLPYFSDLSKVVECRPFSSPPESRLDPPDTMKITHISAHFQTFVAYSTGSKSLVLIGSFDTDPDAGPPPAADSFRPMIRRSLQYQSVISVVLGDYHYGALTSTGNLLTWGAYSKGALGLGNPKDLPVGSPGGFEFERHLIAARTTGVVRATPPDVQEPTEVRFDHGLKKRRQMYCFGATAAGWHTGALVVDLEPDAEEPELSDSEPMPGAFPPDRGPSSGHGPRVPIIPLGRGRGIASPFRIGFAGRGTGR